MTTGIVIILAVVLALALMTVISQRQSVTKMKALLKEAQEQTLLLEQKVEGSREALKKNKEELEREKNALRDARELNKKKLRRQAEGNYHSEHEAAAMTTITSDDSQAALRALEAQIEHMKSEFSRSEAQLRSSLEEEFKKKHEAQLEEVQGFKKKMAELQEEIKKQKRLLRPEGNKIDLKILPDEAASEFARIYRKAEQHERLHGIARAKLQLAQEKFTDLQKRYFSVCRELAVAVGKKEDITPTEAREVAEELVQEHQNDHEQSKA